MVQTIEEKCTDCNKILKIPLEIWEEVNNSKNVRPIEKEHPLKGSHDNFYISPYFNFYCDSNCYDMFVSD